MDPSLRVYAATASNLAADAAGYSEEVMKKSWKKPSMCQVPAGMEISRYLPAEIAPKK